MDESSQNQAGPAEVEQHILRLRIVSFAIEPIFLGLLIGFFQFIMPQVLSTDLPAEEKTAIAGCGIVLCFVLMTAAKAIVSRRVLAVYAEKKLPRLHRVAVRWVFQYSVYFWLFPAVIIMGRDLTGIYVLLLMCALVVAMSIYAIRRDRWLKFKTAKPEDRIDQPLRNFAARHGFADHLVDCAPA